MSNQENTTIEQDFKSLGEELGQMSRSVDETQLILNRGLEYCRLIEALIKARQSNLNLTRSAVIKSQDKLADLIRQHTALQFPTGMKISEK